MTHERFAHHDAAYVLGALDPAERQAYQAHLHDCALCRAEVEEIADTAALLCAPRMRAELGAVLDPDAGPGADPTDPGTAEPPLPDTLLPGLLRSIARQRRRRRVLTGALGALAAACLVVLAVVIWPSGSNPTLPPAIPFAAVQPNPVRATAVLISRPWGTSIELHCRYAAGVTASLPYELRVIDRAQKVHTAGAWTLLPGRDIRFTGGTDVARADIAAVQITLDDGTPILQLRP